MKYFSKKRFTMRQVVGLLTVVFLGIAAIAYAAMTKPHNFVAGDTIRAGEVNKNFDDLYNAMPAVKQVTAGTWLTMPTAFNTNIHSITVTPPANGYVMITATGTVTGENSSGDAFFCLDLHDTGTYTGGCTPMAGSDTAVRSYMPATFPTPVNSGFSFGIPYSIIKVFPVSGGVSTTFYLNGYVTGYDGAVSIFHPTLTALFVPSLLP